MQTVSRLTIDLGAIVQNWQALHALAPNAEIGAVVKADAYGHGANRVGPALVNAGCKSFFTATLEEAVSLRAAVGDDPEIIILHGVTKETADEAKALRLRPIVNTLHQLRDWRFGGLVETGPAILHFDTGMNRLGLRPEDVPAVKQMLDDRPVGIVMSHLACADEPDHPLNIEQKALFDAIAAEWPAAICSLVNSAGMALPGYAYDLCRPGIALYGGGVDLPLNGGKLKSTLRFEAPILSVFMAKQGASTGYGASRRFGRHHRLATVAAGYADGLPRALSNSGFAYIGEDRCKIVGRVSMDLVTLDVTDLTCPIAPGMMAEFIGPRANVEQQALEAGTLGYELMTGLGARAERIWNE
ncbi:MAG: alanine racemase [Pseudomonadota bacterium]